MAGNGKLSRAARIARNASIKEQYEESRLTVAHIAAGHGVSESHIWRLIARSGWKRPTHRWRLEGRPGPSPLPDDLVCPGLALCPRRDDLVARLYAQTERQVAAIEARQGEEEGGEGREPAARTMGALVRSLEKLRGMDAQRLGAAVIEAEEAPYDVEGLRRELSERLDRLCQARLQG